MENLAKTLAFKKKESSKGVNWTNGFVSTAQPPDNSCVDMGVHDGTYLQLVLALTNPHLQNTHTHLTHKHLKHCKLTVSRERAMTWVVTGQRGQVQEDSIPLLHHWSISESKTHSLY